MGVFLQTALFPGCTESAAREAVETAAKNSAFQIDPKPAGMPKAMRAPRF